MQNNWPSSVPFTWNVMVSIRKLILVLFLLPAPLLFAGSAHLDPKIAKILREVSPSDQIVSSCIGSFSKEGEYEYAVSTFNGQNSVVTLHVFLFGSAANPQHI